MLLRKENQEDWWEVEALYDLCFAPGREALTSYRFRDGIDPVADLGRLALSGESFLAGAIRYWPVTVSAAPVLLLGPVAVHPIHQGEGIGAALIRDSLDAASQGGWERVLLVGDEPYYRRFGFQRLKKVKMPAPTNPERVLGLELVPDGWRGICGEVARTGKP